MDYQTDDLRIKEIDELIPPVDLLNECATSRAAAATVWQTRQAVHKILHGADDRLLVIMGPCSIHDIKAAKEFAQRLSEAKTRLAEDLLVVMRVYFEKPRTTTGWKGLINDPCMDDSFHIERGLKIARGLLLEIAELGLPAGTEALDPIVPQYLSDLITWTAVGARTAESQTHREMASGLSTPVGFKNSTDGSLQVAINALLSASKPHSFLGINLQGECTVVHTRGNPYGHVVLRGGATPNYDPLSVAEAEHELRKHRLAPNLMIDCSHANSGKDPARQGEVFLNCVDQRWSGTDSIVGLMLESNLEWGSQPVPEDLGQLRYGVSVTDACIDWPTTETLLREAHRRLGEAARR